MTSKLAIDASLVDVRNYDTEKCVKLTIHVPAERATEVMAIFGWPTRVNPVPVAIARLDLSKVEPVGPAKEAFYNEKPARDKKHWPDLPPSQQAAIRCNEPGFIRWLHVCTPGEAAEVVRARCGVTSRAQICIGTPAERLWRALDDAYVVEVMGYEGMITR